MLPLPSHLLHGDENASGPNARLSGLHVSCLAGGWGKILARAICMEALGSRTECPEMEAHTSQCKSAAPYWETVVVLPPSKEKGQV